MYVSLKENAAGGPDTCPVGRGSYYASFKIHIPSSSRCTGGSGAGRYGHDVTSQAAIGEGKAVPRNISRRSLEPSRSLCGIGVGHSRGYATRKRPETRLTPGWSRSKT